MFVHGDLYIEEAFLGYLLTLENHFSIAWARLHSKKQAKDRAN